MTPRRGLDRKVASAPSYPPEASDTRSQQLSGRSPLPAACHAVLRVPIPNPRCPRRLCARSAFGYDEVDTADPGQVSELDVEGMRRCERRTLDALFGYGRRDGNREHQVRQAMVNREPHLRNASAAIQGNPKGVRAWWIDQHRTRTVTGQQGRESRRPTGRINPRCLNDQALGIVLDEWTILRKSRGAFSRGGTGSRDTENRHCQGSASSLSQPHGGHGDLSGKTSELLSSRTGLCQCMAAPKVGALPPSAGVRECHPS